jgi:hypothetical protein
MRRNVEAELSKHTIVNCTSTDTSFDNSHAKMAIEVFMDAKVR